MPGICGIAARSPADVTAQLEDMLDRLEHFAWYRRKLYSASDAGVALGCSSLGFVNPPEPKAFSAGSLRIVLDGEVTNRDQLLRELQAGNGSTAETGAELLLAGYEQHGREFFKRVEGKYTAAIWHESRRRLILVNDKLGMKPLYYVKPAEQFSFASEIKALLASSSKPFKSNHAGIIQFFTFGHLWGEESFYEGIRALPPGAWLEYDVDVDQLSLERYCSLQPATPAPNGEREALDRIDAAFTRSVAQCTTGDGRLGLSLSGGLDARSILGVAADETARSITSVCMGMEGSLDHRAAEELARIAGSPYHAYILNETFLSQFETHLRRMVHLTDGHYLSQCIVLPTLDFYRDLGIEVLLRGHGGELMHMQKAYNFSLDREALQLQTDSQLSAWLFQHLRAYMLDNVDQPLLQFADNRDAESIARETILSALEETSGWESPINRISHLFVTQRLRRETAMSLVKFGSVVETRLPYVDAELIELLLSLPIESRLGETIQSHILGKHRPEFLDVVNANTGCRLGAGPLPKACGMAKKKVLAKLGVKGYQPYERLGLWLRRELRPLVREILLSQSCLDRGVFRPETVHKVVSEHLENKRNHTYLLLAMMIFELGQQEFADGISAAQPTPRAIQPTVTMTAQRL